MIRINHSQKQLLLLAILYTLAFLTLAYIVTHQLFFQDINQALYQYFITLRNPALEKIIVAVSFLGDKSVLAVPIVVTFIWLLWQRNYWTALHWGANAFFIMGAIGILKPFIHSARPGDLLGHSFPSGHSTLAVAIYGFLAVLVCAEKPPNKHRLIYTFSIILALAIIFTRLYLGAHWLTDVIGGALLGLGCIFFFSFSYGFTKPPLFDANKTYLVFSITLGLTWLYFLIFETNAALLKYAPSY